MMIDAETRLYGLFGNPVGHSLSPAMHNAAFKEKEINAAYLAFGLENAQAALAAMRTLNMGGASVTIPHKTDVMAHLDEVDEMAARIGAVNTIVNRRGRLVGFNTDVTGAMRALNACGGVKGKRVLVIGAGGAARAIAFGISEAGGELVIANRTEKRAESLAHELFATFQPLKGVSLKGVDVLINTTSVGMAPNIDEAPVALSELSSETLVMDIVYNPLETALLSGARAVGCETIDGVAMFVGQAVAQFELWTGLEAPEALMQSVVMRSLKRNR